MQFWPLMFVILLFLETKVGYYQNVMPVDMEYSFGLSVI